MKKRTIIYIIIALVAIGAIATSVYYYQKNNVTTNKTRATDTNIKTPETNKNISYKGEFGLTALELLEKNAEIVTSGTGENAFVTTINGVQANPKNQYWAFSINGKLASEGAGSYVTQDTDTITWKLTSF